MFNMFDDCSMSLQQRVFILVDSLVNAPTVKTCFVKHICAKLSWRYAPSWVFANPLMPDESCSYDEVDLWNPDHCQKHMRQANLESQQHDFLQALAFKMLVPLIGALSFNAQIVVKTTHDSLSWNSDILSFCNTSHSKRTFCWLSRCLSMPKSL